MSAGKYKNSGVVSVIVMLPVTAVVHTCSAAVRAESMTRSPVTTVAVHGQVDSAGARSVATGVEALSQVPTAVMMLSPAVTRALMQLKPLGPPGAGRSNVDR